MKVWYYLDGTDLQDSGAPSLYVLGRTETYSYCGWAESDWIQRIDKWDMASEVKTETKLAR